MEMEGEEGKTLCSPSAPTRGFTVLPFLQHAVLSGWEESGYPSALSGDTESINTNQQSNSKPGKRGGGELARGERGFLSFVSPESWGHVSVVSSAAVPVDVT